MSVGSASNPQCSRNDVWGIQSVSGSTELEYRTRTNPGLDNRPGGQRREVYSSHRFDVRGIGNLTPIVSCYRLYLCDATVIKRVDDSAAFCQIDYLVIFIIFDDFVCVVCNNPIGSPTAPKSNLINSFSTAAV